MKKLISVILVFLLACSCAAPAFAADSGDIFSPWSQNYITDARQVYHILPDCLTSGDYTKNITREEFCDLAYETMGCMKGNIAYNEALTKANENGESFDVSAGPQKIYPTASSTVSPFTDTDDKSIVTLNGIGIIQGKGNGIFAPDDLLTREEAATILGRIADYFSLRHFENETVFTDANSISTWATDGVDTVCGMGIMNGMGDGSFSPQSNYTKEQSIATMIREINAVPYLGNREEISDGEYFIFNSFWLWVEDQNGKVLFKLPAYWATYNYRTDYGYSSMKFFKHDGKMLVASIGISNDPNSLSYKKSGTTFFGLDSGKEQLFLPISVGCFYALSKDHNAIIMEDTRYSAPTVDAAYSVYAVYDFNGNELIPPGSDWQSLYDAGYVDTKYSVNYVW